MKITGSVGDKRRINDAIRRFKNERYPNIVVTVALLTTGIDVPQIDTLIFMCRVKSRILFEEQYTFERMKKDYLEILKSL